MAKPLHIAKSNTYFQVQFEFNKEMVEQIKRVPVRKFDGQKQLWLIPVEFPSNIEAKGTPEWYVEAFASWAVRKGFVSGIKRLETMDEKDIPDLPEMPDLTVPHGLLLEPFPYQLQGIAYSIKYKRCILGDQPGLGKAQTLNSLIVTPKGWVKMGNVKVGDKIFSKNGTIQLVEGVFPQGIVPTYRVTMNDGSLVDCNLDHLWVVRDVNRRKRGTGWIVKTTHELIESGLVWNPCKSRSESGRKPILKWEIPMCDPVQFECKDYVIPAYTMGALIGDGHLHNISSPQLSLPDEKKGIIDRISKEIEHSMRVTSKKYGNVNSYTIVSHIDNYHHQNNFIEEIRAIQLDVLSVNKFIPIKYLQGSVQQRYHLLAGLMDTDGSCIKNRTTFHTTSTRLAFDVKQLVESLGGVAIVRPYDRSHEGKPLEYQVNIRTSFNPFSVEYKKNAWSPNKMFKPVRYIESIEYIGAEEQQCIKVSSSDHMYLTNDYIVTHNTMQAIGGISIPKAYPCLVICPASLKINWQREWKKFAGKNAIILDDSNKNTWHRYYEMGACDIFIVNFESLKKFFVESIKYVEDKNGKKRAYITYSPLINLFKAVIIDESHKCRSGKTQQSKFCEGIAKGKEHVLLLTGTPVVNNNEDLIPQLRIMNRLDDFGGYMSFVNNFCQGSNKSSNFKLLNWKLWNTCFFRREKQKVLKDLPDKMRQVMTVDISNRKEYQDAELDFLTYLRNYRNADDAKLARAQAGEVMVRMQLLRQIAAKGKMNAVAEFISDLLEQGQKLILFAYHKEVVHEFKKRFPNCSVCVTGDETVPQKQHSVDSFQNDPKIKLIICNYKSAGVGLTLTASSEVDFIEFPWTFADCEQAEDRAHRIGQKDSVSCRYFLGKQTIDEYSWQIIMTKKNIADGVTGTDDQVPVDVVDMMANFYLGNKDGNKTEFTEDVFSGTTEASLQNVHEALQKRDNNSMLSLFN